MTVAAVAAGVVVGAVLGIGVLFWRIELEHFDERLVSW